MTTGSMLYLLMTIAGFVVFGAALAYQSWQQSRLGPDVMASPAPQNRDAEPQGALHA